jgi:hypothetical protein
MTAYHLAPLFIAVGLLLLVSHLAASVGIRLTWRIVLSSIAGVAGAWLVFFAAFAV